MFVDVVSEKAIRHAEALSRIKMEVTFDIKNFVLFL